jgi:hypothetical protein
LVIDLKAAPASADRHADGGNSSSACITFKYVPVFPAKLEVIVLDSARLEVV